MAKTDYRELPSFFKFKVRDCVNLRGNKLDYVGWVTDVCDLKEYDPLTLPMKWRCHEPFPQVIVVLRNLQEVHLNAQQLLDGVLGSYTYSVLPPPEIKFAKVDDPN